MTDQEENPLVAALPPETDYLTYLTIVEYNLNKEQLPLLHDLLQDTKLTTNIGWDLVHLLLPLLPESEQCLQDIAFLGNPRETVLKVAELLENLSDEAAAAQEESQQDDSDEDEQKDQEKSASAAQSKTDLLSLQFHSLSHMLCILHPRIKTKNPSRFLTTSLKAVLQAYKNIQDVSYAGDSKERLQSTTRAIFMIVKSMSGSKRPHLPPRRTQSAIPQVSKGNAAPDPEGQEETVAPGETILQKHILQLFVIQALEVYVQSLEPIASIDSALAWSSRYHERQRPVPGKPKFAQEFEVEEELERADATIGQLLSLAEGDLQVSWDTVLKYALSESSSSTQSESIFTIDDFPASKPGFLYALAARAASSLQHDRPLPFDISIFPEHSVLVELFVNDWASDIDGDALVILGRAALASHGLGEWETRAEFNQYLQHLSQLTASSGLPNIASQASELTATILHSHPSSDARFDFIQDTLENCPYPDLKEAAILWLKDEILVAFSLSKFPPIPGQDNEEQQSSGTAATFGETSNVFTHPETLATAAASIFIQPVSQEGEGQSASVTDAKFWLAALNLYYLLCASKQLYEMLEVQALDTELSIDKNFITPLEAMVHESHTDTSSQEGINEGYRAFLPLIDDALIRIRHVQEKATAEATTKATSSA